MWEAQQREEEERDAIRVVWERQEAAAAAKAEAEMQAQAFAVATADVHELADGIVAVAIETALAESTAGGPADGACMPAGASPPALETPGQPMRGPGKEKRQAPPHSPTSEHAHSRKHRAIERDQRDAGNACSGISSPPRTTPPLAPSSLDLALGSSDTGDANVDVCASSKPPEEEVAMAAAAITRVQATQRGRFVRRMTLLAPTSLRREATMLIGGRDAVPTDANSENELLRIGHAANARKDFGAARLNFQAAYMMFGYKVEAQLSAANMALKLGEVELAASEYQEILRRNDVQGWVRGRVVQKLQVATAIMKSRDAQDVVEENAVPPPRRQSSEYLAAAPREANSQVRAGAVGSDNVRAAVERPVSQSDVVGVAPRQRTHCVTPSAAHLKAAQSSNAVESGERHPQVPVLPAEDTSDAGHVRRGGSMGFVVFLLVLFALCSSLLATQGTGWKAASSRCNAARFASPHTERARERKRPWGRARRAVEKVSVPEADSHYDYLCIAREVVHGLAGSDRSSQ